MRKPCGESESVSDRPARFGPAADRGPADMTSIARTGTVLALVLVFCPGTHAGVETGVRVIPSCGRLRLPRRSPPLGCLIRREAFHRRDRTVCSEIGRASCRERV